MSQEEMNARLNMAEDINKNFPFLIGHYKIKSTISIDSRGNEIGALALEIVSTPFGEGGGEVSMELVLNKYLKSILNQDIAKHNDRLRKENKELKLKLAKYENKVPKRSNKIIS